LHYAVCLTPDEDTILVTCPDLPEVTTFGEDRAAALRNATGAVEEALAARLDAFEEIPRPGADGDAKASVGLGLAVKVTLYLELAEAGLNRAELARRLGWHRNSVDRLFDPNHASKLDQFDAAFAALGRTVDVRAEAEPA
jgi:antitoxin HicB